MLRSESLILEWLFKKCMCVRACTCMCVRIHVHACACVCVLVHACVSVCSPYPPSGLVWTCITGLSGTTRGQFATEAAITILRIDDMIKLALEPKDSGEPL